MRKNNLINEHIASTKLRVVSENHLQMLFTTLWNGEIITFAYSKFSGSVDEVNSVKKLDDEDKLTLIRVAEKFISGGSK